MLDVDSKTFVMQVAIQKQEEMPIYLENKLKLGPYYLTKLLLKSWLNILIIAMSFQWKMQLNF